ncbi:ribonuclease HII [Acetobacter sp. AN02]|uniref:ribonuclease HII n=1 Tax=Acetobacter sp. AN02 TaxID=2894186 RepID=UPI00243459A5|nr:ribonuclease HII [Acetobacter sp. AN02]MDG6093972.1 ribonuclease HII [Acetobacter sp. AN02]
MPDYSREARHGGRVAGVDEAGCGPLAGPVIAAAVVLPAAPGESLCSLLNDSKKLTERQRRQAFDALHAEPGVEIGVGAASVREIHELNILNASQLAMRRAISRLRHLPELALVDGSRRPALPCAVETVVGGDALSLSIAAASVVAKVTRDRAMHRLDRRWPAYGWAKNAGYGTKKHREALAVSGVTPHHRQDFGTVKRYLQQELYS